MGNPRCLRLSGGQVDDLQMAAGLIEHEQRGAVVADKAYDRNMFLTFIEQAGVQAVMPPKTSRLEQRAYDENLYADEQSRAFLELAETLCRLATQYEKTACNFLAFWQIACCVMLTV